MESKLYTKPHRRKDPLTDRLVTIVPSSDAEVRAFIAGWRSPNGTTTGNPYEPWCYYCPGNERFTNDDIDGWTDPGIGRIRATTKAKLDVTVKESVLREPDGPYDCMTSYGADETVIIGDDHSQRLSTVSPILLTDSLIMCHNRIASLAGDKQLKGSIFWADGNNFAKQYGYIHPCWHISSEATVLPRAGEELAGSRNYYENRKERCLMCDIIKEETIHSPGTPRLIRKTNHFVVFAPYASRHPFVLDIVPLRHVSHFERTENIRPVCADLAEIVQSLLHTYELMFGPRFAYTLEHHNPPRVSTGVSEEILVNACHWYLRLKPLLKPRPIREDTTGENTHPIPPETAARLLTMEDSQLTEWLVT